MQAKDHIYCVPSPYAPYSIWHFPPTTKLNRPVTLVVKLPHTGDTESLERCR